MKRLPVFLAVIIFILYGCVTPATTQNEWSNPEAKIDSTKVFQKILLVALVKDNATRKIVEDKLAEQVKPRGIVSYNYLPNLETNESTLSNKLKSRWL
jgi:PBP1b-binding outer membrane lipoprotein LpoB